MIPSRTGAAFKLSTTGNKRVLAERLVEYGFTKQKLVAFMTFGWDEDWGFPCMKVDDLKTLCKAKGVQHSGGPLNSCQIELMFRLADKGIGRPGSIDDTFREPLREKAATKQVPPPPKAKQSRPPQIVAQTMIGLKGDFDVFYQ